MELTILKLILLLSLLSRWYRSGRSGHCHIRQSQKEDRFVCVHCSACFASATVLCFVDCSGQPLDNPKSAHLHCIFGKQTYEVNRNWFVQVPGRAVCS